jgi:Glycosyl transferases group 1
VSASKRRLGIGIELINDPTWMGGVLYLQNLAICLARLPDNERPHVQLLGSPDVVDRFVAGNAGAGVLGNKSGFLHRLARKIGLKIADPTIDVVYPGFGREVDGAVTMRWIPDFQHRYMPHLFSSDEIAARDRSIGELAARPGIVIFSSEVAAADFRSFYPDHVATPRVWHFCSLLETAGAADSGLAAKYSLPPKFLYLPNQFWAHKNHITVLQALAHLKREHRLTIPLVCTGAQSDRRNESHFAGLVAFIENNDLKDQVQLLGLIDRMDQVEIFRRATAIVQPSLFEGWSTVVEDTRAIGRPIFLSDLAVHREQAPAHCTYFDPNDPTDLVAKLAEAWHDLESGPDAAAESLARRDMEGRILSAGRIFHEIARQAMEIGRG